MIYGSFTVKVGSGFTAGWSSLVARKAHNLEVAGENPPDAYFTCLGDRVAIEISTLFENPAVPSNVAVAPYWGPINQVPPDRRLREEHGAVLPPDSDVSDCNRGLIGM